MLCDEVSVLEETLKILGDMDLHIRRLGSRGFLVPADEMGRILDLLAQAGTFPRVVRAAGVDDDTHAEVSS